jgi:hypothetical protein
MKTIEQFQFPETPEEAATWKPVITYKALCSTVLLVAKTRIEGQWACYCTPVPGQSHDQEKHMWQTNGTKVRQSIARAAFLEFNNLPYAE